MSAALAMPREVSVVISCRNRSGLLRDCMRGLARQTIGLERFEVVLVDNQSTEDLSVVVAEARAMGLDIRMLRTTEDRGPAPARNLGVEQARGAIIAFTDSDCRPTPGWLAAVLPHFGDPAVAFMGGPVLAKPGQAARLTSRMTFVTPTEHPTFPTANLAMRRALFVAHGGFDTSLSFHDPFGRATECADTDLAWRLLEAGHRRGFEPLAVVEHEVEHQSLGMWLIEPTRLFVLPELVRRHPQLRDKLLSFGVLFYAPSKLLYLAVPLLAWIAVAMPVLLAALPVALLARGVQRTGGLHPGKLAMHAARVLANLPRLVVLNATLIYGSIRFRSLVL
jgi:glycosyltransferase involved in cell wall biosynthesis